MIVKIIKEFYKFSNGSKIYVSSRETRNVSGILHADHMKYSDMSLLWENCSICQELNSIHKDESPQP